MPHINVLDNTTIDKIAAGEVIERPSSIVKEMLENAIDAKATAITIEIKEGGKSFIRITDNGFGIAKTDIKLAFFRHATSKITSIEDLLCVSSLGFRGEALSSIAAISQVECITKTPDSLVGIRYVIEGGQEKSIEEIGAPNGTTFVIRNIFYNTPARRKFLKTDTTEASYISSVVEHIALSHPEVSIRFINNSNNKLHTSGNSKLKEIIYNIFGRDVTSNLIDINSSFNGLSLNGFIGKPIISRGNRNYMNYFINGRYIKSKIVNNAIEDAYKPYMMQHNYPFCVLHFSIDQSLLDVNVHPTKMELRFENSTDVYNYIYNVVSEALKYKELIPQVDINENLTKSEINKGDNISNKKESVPEPFETNRINKLLEKIADTPEALPEANEKEYYTVDQQPQYVKEEQLELFDNRFLSKSEKVKHKMIGQLFDTYWLIEYNENLYIVDQHAAHEKVLFEKTMNALKNKTFTSQQLNPPIILTLSATEEELINKFMNNFNEIGYEIESFGGREYAVRAVPGNLYSIGTKELLLDIIDTLSTEASNIKSEMISEKIASMSCKAAVKGNNKLTFSEADSLIEQLLALENPYNCPHGRPTIISMSKYDIERKFKRIL